MNDDKRVHLELIQNVIVRMSSNSFIIKGWTVTLVSAFFALAAKDADSRYVLVTYFAIPVFWLLDAFYLAQERRYRDLYDASRQASSTDFSLDASGYRNGQGSWCKAAFSGPLMMLYAPIFVIALIVMFVLELD